MTATQHCELCNAAAPSLVSTRYGNACRPCAREAGALPPAAPLVEEVAAR